LGNETGGYKYIGEDGEVDVRWVGCVPLRDEK